MVSKEIIEEVKNRLITTYNPVAIYLFGSYAWGSPTEDSDLDLLIIVDHSDEKSYKRSIPGYDVLFGLGISKDLIVAAQEEFLRRSSDVTTLEYKIKNEGEVIYARA